MFFYLCVFVFCSHTRMNTSKNIRVFFLCSSSIVEYFHPSIYLEYSQHTLHKIQLLHNQTEKKRTLNSINSMKHWRTGYNHKNEEEEVRRVNIYVQCSDMRVRNRWKPRRSVHFFFGFIKFHSFKKLYKTRQLKGIHPLEMFYFCNVLIQFRNSVLSIHSMHTIINIFCSLHYFHTFFIAARPPVWRNYVALKCNV